MNTPTSLLLQAAEQAAGHQQFPPGTLYVVATPLGNLADLSLRAVATFARADAVACEDTRVTGQLLAHLGLHRPLVAVHAHNEAEASEGVLARLSRDERVVLVSDAGTPAVSDPGALLVAKVAAQGHRVVPVPGPSSALAAISVAGDAAAAVAGSGFRVAGFLPQRGSERDAALVAALAEGGTVVLFESPHRIASLATSLADAAPQRRVTVARELTKQFETIATLDAAALPAWLEADANRLRGEFTLVLHAAPQAAAAGEDDLPAEALRTLDVLLRDLPLKQAVALAAEISGAPRNALYRRALAQRDEAS